VTTKATTKKTQVFSYHLRVLAFALLIFSNSSIAKSDAIQLKEVQWLSEQSNLVTALTQRPSECINPNAATIATIGRIAFQSSALLGGQAARMGLSCASCHPSGRTNVNFFLNTVSNAPGTADVTHHFFSSNGGNGTLTAVMIPDLANPDQSRIKDRWSKAFRQKLKQLIEIEFDGQPAPPTVLDGLQTYLANMDLKFCNKNTSEPIRLIDDWTDLIDIIDALPLYSDNATNTFLIRASRKQLEQIYWRFKNINNLKLDDALITLSRQLEQTSLESTSHQEQIESLKNWQTLAKETYVFLQEEQKKSSYNPNVIKSLITE